MPPLGHGVNVSGENSTAQLRSFMLDTCWRHEHRIVNGGLEVRKHTVLARRLSTLKVPLFDDPRLELLFLGFALLLREIRGFFSQESGRAHKQRSMFGMPRWGRALPCRHRCFGPSWVASALPPPASLGGR